ncbi:hypothetical protein D0Z07_3531 [Hyphodiscus hymeniophilus]|uniref:N-acetyltransferase domain-containing protein n=1 Tax=Hyphodiscus hymeniophilus TaxID=353542 RepID=A0A9P6VKD0_9HELO|nr:hypothetical protein D0Z07_3531 [Hyphodiscus hymeniophilus]
MDETKKQPLLLLEAEPADALEILEMHIASFSNPLERSFFVFFPAEEPRDQGVKRMIDGWLGDPTATYLKVVEPESGKIVAAAKWCIYNELPTEAQLSEKHHVDWLADADSIQWGEQVLEFLYQERASKLRSGVRCIIDMISTAPEHQRRGAGSMLIKWGTDIADARGMSTFVQGTKMGRHLYEPHGFIAERWVTVPVEEKWRDKPLIEYFSLERPPKILDSKGP